MIAFMLVLSALGLRESFGSAVVFYCPVKFTGTHVFMCFDMDHSIASTDKADPRLSWNLIDKIV